MTPFPPPVALRWRPFRLPLRARFEAAHGATASRAGVLVQARDEAGRAGLGEASPYPSLGGGTVDDVLALLTRHGAAACDAGTLDAGPGVEALRCALDAATLDLAGQAAGQPVAALLTPRPAASVAVNAVVGGGTPDEVVGYALDAVGAGYRTLKFKVGVSPAAEEARVIAAVREACPGVAIRLDANGAWGEAAARAAIEAFAPYGVEWLEQPVPAAEVEALGRIAAASPIRIAADESLTDPATRARVVELDSVDVVVLKPMMLGGLRPALEVARRATAAMKAVVVTTTFDSSAGTAVALHLAAAVEASARAEVAHGLSTGEHLGADICASPLVPSGGRLALPAGPGLGVALDASALDAVATAPWSDWTSR